MKLSKKQMELISMVYYNILRYDPHHTRAFHVPVLTAEVLIEFTVSSNVDSIVSRFTSDIRTSIELAVKTYIENRIDNHEII